MSEVDKWSPVSPRVAAKQQAGAHHMRNKTTPKLMTLTSGLFERILILRRSPFFHGVSDQELQRYDSDDSLARCGIEPRLRRLSSFFKEEVFRTAGTVILEEGRDS